MPLQTDTLGMVELSARMLSAVCAGAAVTVFIDDSDVLYHVVIEYNGRYVEASACTYPQALACALEILGR